MTDNDSILKIDKFFKQYKSFQYKKRETIVFAGDIPAGVFYITQGYVRSFTVTMDGREFTRRLYKAFDFFPVRSVLRNVVSPYSYEALTDLEVIRAPKEDFITFLENDSKILYYVTNYLLERLNETLKRLEVTLMEEAKKKVIVTLIFLAEGVGITEKNTIVINVPFTHQEIASMTGLTRETVSLEIEKLIKQGIITIQQDRLIRISDINKLKEFIAF